MMMIRCYNVVKLVSEHQLAGFVDTSWS